MTELYNIRFKSPVKKDLRSLPKQDVLRILNALEHLAKEPTPDKFKAINRMGCMENMRGAISRDLHHH